MGRPQGSTHLTCGRLAKSGPKAAGWGTKLSTEIERDQVGAALGRVLKSAKFASSGQLADFLSYVVKEQLEGRSGSLKAYNIAVEALGRPATFDPELDTIVRVVARRVRNALAVYYATDGASDPVCIKIRKGAYVPSFTLNDLKPSESLAVACSTTTPNGERSARPRPGWFLAERPYAWFSLMLLIVLLTTIHCALHCRGVV